MSFTDYFKQTNEVFDIEAIIAEEFNIIDNPNFMNAVNILRERGYKIKLETPTYFGVQIDFAKEYDESELKTLLVGFDITVDGDKIFIHKSKIDGL